MPGIISKREAAADEITKVCFHRFISSMNNQVTNSLIIQV